MDLNEQQYYYPQQQTPVTPNELYAQEMNEDKIKNIIQQISPNNQLEDIEMRLRGYKKNITNGCWEKIIDRVVPEEMINRYISWLSSYMSLNITLGNLSNVQLANIMKLIIKWIVDDVDSHAKEYGFESDYTERTRVADILVISSFSVLNRSLNGAEARRFWSSLSLSESSSMNPQQANKSDWWKFWKK